MGLVGGAPVPPLVGNIAPDFSAQAVYDQEFVDITLSQYRVNTVAFACWCCYSL